MVVDVIGLILGLSLLVAGAHGLVGGASDLARDLGASPVLVGTAVVGVGSALPELVTAVLAARVHAAPIALGSALGATTLNLTVVLGIVGLLTAPSIEARLLRREAPATVLAAGLLAGLCQFRLGRLSGVVLLLGLVGIVLLLRRRAAEDLAALRADPPPPDPDGPVRTPPVGIEPRERRPARASSPSAHPEAPPPGGRAGQVRRRIALVAAGLFATVGGAGLVVHAVRLLATVSGIGGGALGLTAVAVGGSLPELATALAARRQHAGELVIGNVLGSSLTNCLAVTALVAIVDPGPVPARLARASLATVVAALAGVACVWTGRRLRRREGLVLLGLYGLLLWFSLL